MFQQHPGMSASTEICLQTCPALFLTSLPPHNLSGKAPDFIKNWALPPVVSPVPKTTSQPMLPGFLASREGKLNCVEDLGGPKRTLLIARQSCHQFPVRNPVSSPFSTWYDNITPFWYSHIRVFKTLLRSTFKWHFICYCLRLPQTFNYTIRQ